MRFVLRGDEPLSTGGLRRKRRAELSVDGTLRALRSAELRRDWGYWRRIRTSPRPNRRARCSLSRGCFVQSRRKCLGNAPHSAGFIRSQKVHGDNEFRRIQSAALFRVCQVPYPPKDLVRQSGALEYCLGRVACPCQARQSSKTENIPDMTPPRISDFSNREVNLFTSSGFNGGTRIGAPAPLGGGLVVPVFADSGGSSTGEPSNFGNGPARQLACSNKSSREAHAAAPIHR